MKTISSHYFLWLKIEQLEKYLVNFVLVKSESEFAKLKYVSYKQIK